MPCSRNTAGLFIFMKYLVIFFIFFIITYDSNAQKNFSKGIRGGYRAATIYNAILDKDTIIAYGNVIDSTWGAWFVKLDTLGNILMQKQYKIVPNFQIYGAIGGWSLIKTNDNGYAFIGVSYYIPNDGILIKVKHNGDLDFIKYYPAINPVELVWYPRLIEYKTGFYLLSEKLNKGEIYRYSTLIKTDKKGDIIWEKKQPLLIDRYLDFTMQTDTSLLIGGGIVVNNKGKPVLYVLDTNGVEQKKYIDTLNNGAGAFFLKKSAKGWVFINIEAQPYNGIEPEIDYYVNGTDENFKSLWHKKVGWRVARSECNGLQPMGNDEYLALISLKPATKFSPTHTYDGAFLQKFNGKGDLIWSRMDTLFSWGVLCENSYTSAIPLPSGNIILTGYAEKCNTQDSTYGVYAWVAKINKHGCLLEPACGMIGNGETFDIQSIKAFPNPTQDYFNLQWLVPNNETWHCVLYDYSGRMLQRISVVSGNNGQQLSLADYTNGLYFYELRSEKGQQISQGKIVLSR